MLEEHDTLLRVAGPVWDEAQQLSHLEQKLERSFYILATVCGAEAAIAFLYMAGVDIAREVARAGLLLVAQATLYHWLSFGRYLSSSINIAGHIAGSPVETTEPDYQPDADVYTSLLSHEDLFGEQA